MQIGARAVLESVLDPDAGHDVSVMVVWIAMLPADSVEAAEESAGLFASFGNVRQYFDPTGQVGREIAAGLGAAEGEVAWDAYLLYGVEAVWDSTPPGPADWAHQLRHSPWADPTKYHAGEGLTLRLKELLAVRGSSS